MPLPVAHCLIGASIVAASRFDVSVSKDWKKLAFGAALAAAPDLDFLLVWIFDFSPDWHRGFSHSITLGVCLSLAIYLIRGKTYLRDAVVYGIAMISHGLLDALVSIRGGVELLWPIPHRFAFGLTEYPDALEWSYHASTDALVIQGVNELIMSGLYELLICGVIFVAVLLLNRMISNANMAALK